MLTASQIEALRGQSEQLLDPIIDFLIEDIAKRVAQAGQFTATASYDVWKLQQLGVSQKHFKKEIAKRLGVSQKKAERLLTQAAETGYSFDMSRFPTSHAIPMSANSSLQQILDATVKLAGEDLTNITRTMGFVGPDGVCRELTDAYVQACDYAFQKVSTGAQDYISAIRDATRNLAEKGIRSIDYRSGYHTSVEAAVRKNIMGGLGQMQQQISQSNHDYLGCDGWEISAHAGSAPDHEPYQGRQYTDAEYERLNNSLVRCIGTLNCGHAASPIIFGVNDPQYTDEEMEAFRQQNEEGVTVEGRHYTLYEATQRQRKFERTIRKQKRRILVDESTGDADKLQVDQVRLVSLRQAYSHFSKSAGLPEQHARMEAAGFSWKEGKAAEAAANKYYKYWSKSIGANESLKTLADYYEMKYNNPEEYSLLKQYAKDIETGWISPLSGFDNYRQIYGRIQEELVGKLAANGVVISGQSKHFMQRVIGTMEDPKIRNQRGQTVRRSGVEVKDLIDACLNGESRPIKVDAKTGKRSQTVFNNRCQITINPDDGMLIQCNLL